MKSEDVKIGMRVVYNPGTPNEDRGVVTQKHTNDSWWVVWDSDGDESWITSERVEPESQAIEQKEEEMPDRIEMMMKLLNAAKEGKQIEQVDAGHWYTASISSVSVSNVHQFRVKPEKIKTVGYRRFIWWGVDGYTVETVCEGSDTSTYETDNRFICWIDKEWQYHEAEL